MSWRLWALLPIVLLAVAVGAFVTAGSSLVDLIGKNPPQADAFDVRRVEFEPGEIRVRVTNPQTNDLTIASVTVDDAIVPFAVDGSATLGRLRSSTIVIPYEWVEDDPITVGVTSSTGIETIEEIPAAVETPGLTGSSVLGYAIIGFLVGVLPVGLGLLWLPSLRRVRQEWLTAFMALTAGLLSFLGVEALFEAFALQAAVPGAFGGPGLVLLGVALSYLTMTFLSSRFSASGSGGVVSGAALALLVAIGIGVHNLGEGLAIGTSFAFGQLTLGSFLIVGFMVHNITEGLGIAAPAADEGATLSWRRLALLTAVAGGPAILGAWIGGFVANDVLAVLFFGAAAGAAFEVVVEVGRYVLRRDPAGIRSGWAIGGFLAGIAIMYATGLIAG
ncbi:MAG: hypothetical protein MSC30_08155 [Gaiellaceae bacterium MAG52_C11]|nr:hypothetical protein [Candidatus Gaiellasilicea maunaloa]